MQTEHIVRSYDEELKFLSNRLATMGGHAERMVEQAMAALVNADHGLSRKVIEDDLVLDGAQREIDEKAIFVIARRQPMASDLREIIGSIRLSADLERIGDLSKNIAKRVLALGREVHPKRLIRGVEHMSRLSQEQLKRVLDSYSQRDGDTALDVWHRDGEIDAMYTSLFRELLTYMMEDPRNITSCTHLLFAAKNIERIGDHATNIAETVYYLVHGEPLTDERPKADKSSTTAVPYPES